MTVQLLDFAGGHDLFFHHPAVITINLGAGKEDHPKAVFLLQADMDCAE